MTNYAAYTGRQGEQGTAFSAGDNLGRLTIETTRTLQPGEGLTIAVAWPKGFVREPTSSDKVGYFFSDNAATGAGLLGLLLVIGYYVYVWSKVGRDPEAGTIFPRFKPPEGLSPAAARFVWRMGYDRKAYSAALINMAVKGFMTIEDEGETYRLRHAADQSDAKLTRGEKQIANALGIHNDSILLDNVHHQRISKSIGRLKNSLRNEFEKVFFLTNRKHFYIGLAITTLALFVTALLTSGAPIILFLGVWLVFWTIGCVFLLDRVVTQWRDVFSGGNPFGSTGLAIFLSIFALPFFGAEVGVLSYFWTQVPMLLLLSFVGLGGINILFFYLLQAPTRAGRALMDEIEGFRQYLSVAEKERLDLLNPPEKTPDLFEKFLPYALALDVENEWSEQFSDVLARAAQENPEHGAYRPRWYSGRRWNTYGANGFGSNLSASLSSSVAAAARAPGSSSGSGGGGFSGGGGGGGGGGGW